MKKIDEITQEYLNEEAKVFKNDSKMLDHFLKNLDFALKLPNGLIAVFNKPRIQTEFLFGYSDMGQGASYETASDFAQSAKSEEYFLESNMSKLNASLKKLKDKDEIVRYDRSYQGRTSIITIYFESCSYGCDSSLPELDKESRSEIIKGKERQKANFEKRLRSYLKRYGLSHIRTSTYWMDR